jgi:UDP-glucose 4-epimerase
MGTHLVTGGAGLIGGYVTKALIERGDNVVVMDIRPPSPPRMAWVMKPVWDKVTFVEGSVSDDFPTLVKACKDYKVEKIFHAAALFRTDFELSHSYYSFHVTLQGMLNVCEAARLLDLKRVVFAGTVGEYIHGTVDYSPEPLVESEPMFDPAMGTQPYSASKMAASIIGMCYWQTQGVDWLNTRFSRVWGFGSKRETMQTEGLMIENAVDGTVTRLERGDEKRGQTYVKDLAKGVLLALDVDGKKLKHRVFNLGGDTMASDRDVAAIVKELIPGAKIEVGAGGISRRPFSTESARKELGWKPAYTLREAVRDYIETYHEYKRSQLE